MHLARLAWAAIVANTDEKAMKALRDAVTAEARAFRPGMAISQDLDEFTELAGDALAAAALLHDLGHPPFSHVLEPFFSTLVESWLTRDEEEHWNAVWAGQFHEAAGTLLASTVLERLTEDRRVVAEIILRSDPDDYSLGAGVLHSVLASEIDIDRVDYLMRDAQRAGTEFGAVDYVRLVEALEIRRVGGDFRVAPSAQARSAVETLLVQRSQTYKWIIYHHRVVGTNEALARAVRLAWELRSDQSGTEIFDEEHVVGDLFSRHVPNLNYLRPGLAEVRRSTGIPLAQLDSQREASLRARLVEQLQAGVDDSAILEWLKAASSTSRLLLGEANALRPAVKERLEELIAFTDVVLLRKRRMISVWKTIEDFQVIADDLVQRHDIGLTLIEECNDVLARVDGDGAERVRRYRDQMLPMLVAEGGTACEYSTRCSKSFSRTRGGGEHSTTLFSLTRAMSGTGGACGPLDTRAFALSVREASWRVSGNRRNPSLLQFATRPR